MASSQDSSFLNALRMWPTLYSLKPAFPEKTFLILFQNPLALCFICYSISAHPLNTGVPHVTILCFLFFPWICPLWFLQSALGFNCHQQTLYAKPLTSPALHDCLFQLSLVSVVGWLRDSSTNHAQN